MWKFPNRRVAALLFAIGANAIVTPSPAEEAAARRAPDAGPRVRVNQVGYLPLGPKRATLVTAATAPLEWRLLARDGQVITHGMSLPRGVDVSSGMNVHEIHFDDVHQESSELRLSADGETSHPFDISRELYARLRADALAVFYTQRSGTPILASVAGAAYARPAGHLGLAPNQGDTAVPCQPAEASQAVYGEAWTCDYVLDARGGWYDAGDHGKYVVNGGIAVAQLLATFERSLSARSARPGALGDGSLRVPERQNGVPDILDEARWELEWLLRMQVPEGKPLAGMAHHKLHDDGWTGLPLAPDQDPKPRQLHRPSTAATLNLAAAAAQGARLFRSQDAAFSRRLLASARRAWRAALEHPALYAPGADGRKGGGPYSDSDTSDEVYWAAAELYITTAEPEYAAALRASPHHAGTLFALEGIDWANVAALGRLDLATSRVKLEERERVVRSVLDAADALLAHGRAQPWGAPYAPASGVWAWGSNAELLNNLIVLGTAFDLSGEARYRDGVLEGVDYLFGRNALGRSYVTGYGDLFSQNQHSRMYAAALDPRLPHPPVGTLAGGPNTRIQDPTARELLTGCKPQLCYVDDIKSASTNELAINWNAPLAWVASFLADQGAAEPRAAGTAKAAPARPRAK
jgi:endoglucanase